jgi:hypothetical protein
VFEGGAIKTATETRLNFHFAAVAVSALVRAPGLQAKVDELEEHKTRLHSEIDGPPRIHRGSTPPATKTEAIEILRGLIERIAVSAAGDGLTIELVGEIANMVRLSTGVKSLEIEPFRSSVGRI